MKTRRVNRAFLQAILALLCGSLLLSGCSVLLMFGSDAGNTGGNDLPSGGDIGLIALACPQEPAIFYLDMNHTFSFSPGGQSDTIKIDGETMADIAFCQLTVHQGKVSLAGACRIAYTNHGIMQGNGAQCNVTGEGLAVIEIAGRCEDGTITMEITETPDPDIGLTANMMCGSFSQPYVTFYPPTIHTFTFEINSLGQSFTENGGDMAGFTYTKQWTLRPGS